MSVNQFITTAAAAKMASVLTVEFFGREAAAGRREGFDRFLAAESDAEPQGGDERP